jgi:sterol desaturase/sphingolipid hydroxylase (fatty acid hydroxylase superfamily)
MDAPSPALVRIALQGGAMGLFLGLGALLPRERDQKLLSRDLFVNLATGAGIFVLVAPLMRAIGDTLQLQLIALPDMHDGLRFLLSFLLLDFCRYWLHYAHHRVPFLWSFHRVHHTSERLDATSGLRMHAVDFLQLALLPILLFGVLMDTRSFADWVIPAAMSVGVFFDAFQHANIRMDLAKPWSRAWHMLLNNPHFHVWHHTRDGELRDGNYGNSLLVWDRLFGTDVTRPELPSALGIPDGQALRNDPLGLQLLRPRG